MKNLSIKQIAFYGFIVIFIILIVSSLSMLFLANKYENFQKEHDTLESSYHHMLEYKYFTERLLTTHNLTKETKLWVESKNRFKNSINLLLNQNNLIDETIVNFYKVIEDESNKIAKKLQNTIFKEQNIMEKSILRRLGEGLNSNEASDYYLALTDLKSSIDYLKQYEEFLLDDISTLVNKQKRTLDEKIYDTKLLGFIAFIFIMIFGAIIVYIIIKLIGKTEGNLISIQNKLSSTNNILTVQQNELNSIIDNIPSMIFVKEIDELRFIRINKSGEKLLGLKEEELIGKNNYDLFPKEQADFFTKKDKEVIHSSKVLDIKEEAIDTKNGERILHTRKVIIHDDNGKPIYLLGISEDITEKKEQEKIILEQSKNAAMGEMIGNIAHQWRQPLSIISTGATGMLMQKQMASLSDEQFEKTCNIINDNTQYLSKTIDDFRNFIKNERKFVKFNLKENIEKFLNLVEPSFKRHHIKLILKLDTDVTLEGYPNELLQCFMNIFNNAKDALKNSAHSQKYIFIDTYKEDNNVIIKFKDNAGGIPKDILSRIFEPYFTTKHQSQGTGLGLSMTYNLVTDGMNGTIKVHNETFNYENEFYTGTEFTIILPLDEKL